MALNKPQERCENCIWWADYEPRLWACISEVRGPIGRDRIELRLCRFKPCPNVDRATLMYTDKDYSCGEFHQKDKA